MAEETGWHSMSADECARKLGVDPTKGLAADEAAKRLKRFGPNAIPSRKERPIIRFLEPFAEPMMILLLIVGIIYGFVGELAETAAIFAIIAIIGAVEGIQEGVICADKTRFQLAMIYNRSRSTLTNCRVR